METTLMNQKPEKRVFVRGDVQGLPSDTISWWPAPVREASAALDVALVRREEAEVAHEIALGAYLTALEASAEEIGPALAENLAYTASGETRIFGFQPRKRPAEQPDDEAQPDTDEEQPTNEQIGVLDPRRGGGQPDKDAAVRQHWTNRPDW
jgi:hypothetical protein